VNVFFHTFGCRANQYDTELVRQAFADRGATVVEDIAAADLAVVNSCTVTHESEAKLRRFARRLSRGSVETVVMGCAAALDDGTIGALPSVRAVVGGADPAAVLEAAGFPARPVDRVLRRFGANARGWLKIQDGCDEHCTFCATTLARGANRSRSVAELVLEAQTLARHHAEIVLTGVHIGTYGRGQPTLGALLEALIGAVPDVRFRLSSIEATEVDDTIARLMIEQPRRLAPYLHAPLQSGSDRVLRRMGRHWYTARSYRARLEWLAARLPVFGLGADVIAGFPGETDADHAATVALIRALPFTYLQRASRRRRHPPTRRRAGRGRAGAGSGAAGPGRRKSGGAPRGSPGCHRRWGGERPDGRATGCAYRGLSLRLCSGRALERRAAVSRHGGIACPASTSRPTGVR
jgi:threonylcarbamoyladenosine tRNA methylthiotransferase MtaB